MMKEPTQSKSGYTIRIGSPGGDVQYEGGDGQMQMIDLQNDFKNSRSQHNNTSSANQHQDLDSLEASKIRLDRQS